MVSEDGWEEQAEPKALANSQLSGRFNSNAYGNNSLNVTPPSQKYFSQPSVQGYEKLAGFGFQQPAEVSQPIIRDFQQAAAQTLADSGDMQVQRGFERMNMQNAAQSNAPPVTQWYNNRFTNGQSCAATTGIEFNTKSLDITSNVCTSSFEPQSNTVKAKNPGFGKSTMATCGFGITKGFASMPSDISKSDGFSSSANFESTAKLGGFKTAMSSGGFGASVEKTGFGSSTLSSDFGNKSTFGAASTGFGSTDSEAFSSGGGFNKGSAFSEGSNKSCRYCKEEGHFAKECPNRAAPKLPDKPCPFCQELGHWKSECPKTPNPGVTKCYNCKQEGHTTKECPEPPKCLNCGKEGHKSMECTLPKKEREPLICHNCQATGHHRKDCTEPPKPREDGSKPASTFVPEDDAEESLFNSGVAKGAMFERLMEAPTIVTSGGADSSGTRKILSFDELGLSETIRRNLELCGYTTPTPVQQYTMPIIRQGIDVVSCAQTGSGKTAAYLLPILSSIMETQDYSTSSEGQCCPRAIIIVPTRELANQVYNETRKYAYGTVISCKAVYGGTEVQHLKNDIMKGATIIAATLGRLRHFIEDGTISLDKLRYFVLDEVDRLIEHDSEQIITTIHNKINNKDCVQGIMFSATFPSEVQAQALLLLKPNYKMVTVDAIGSANKCIQQDIECLEQKDKKDRLLELLDIDKNNYTLDPASKMYTKKILIFVSKKNFADTLASIVSQSGLPATTIHADRLQNERSEAMKDFIYGKKAVMIATGVAERGLDIRGVDHVINYDLPEGIDEYIHRIGRTGRLGNSGLATSFYILDKDNKLAPGLVNCLESAGQVVPEWLQKEASGTSTNGFGATGPVDEGDW